MLRLLLITLSLLSLSLPALARGPKLRVALYEAPVKDESLRPYSFFVMTDYSRRWVDDHIEIKYTLPRELTGKKVEILMKGSPGDLNPTVLVGENGVMNCKKRVCSVSNYGALDLNIQDIETHLRTLNLNDIDFNARMRVGGGMVSDPGGNIYLF